jgi:predicted RNA polymerase sigma factor
MAHRGLGMLYEKLGRTSDAAAEYEKYLELSPTANDRGRIQKRVEALKEKVQ